MQQQRFVFFIIRSNKNFKIMSFALLQCFLFSAIGYDPFASKLYGSIYNI